MAAIGELDRVAGDYFAFLRASGFAEESRVPDFYRDGVALVLMRRGREEGREQRAESRNC